MGCKEYNQPDFSIDHLLMSNIESSLVLLEEGICYDQCYDLLKKVAIIFITIIWLLIAKFRLKLKKVGKTTRPFRYDLNQIPYDYTVEVIYRFKGLDLIECLKSMDRGSDIV